MAGQGFHYALLKMIEKEAGFETSNEMLVGTLCMDSLNAIAGNRRRTHFTGGAGCVLPKLEELRFTVGAGCVLPKLEELREFSTMQSWDSGYMKTYITDPFIDLQLFESASQHLPEDAYKNGIRIHLIADATYDDFIATKVFDLSKQAQGIIVERENGTVMDGATFRKHIYRLYPMMDQYLMKKAGITAEDVENVKQVLKQYMNADAAAFIGKYLNFNEELVWNDSSIFKKADIDKMSEEIVAIACEYMMAMKDEI